MNPIRAHRIAWLAPALVALVGCLWILQRGSPDFSVFHSAWRLVLEGRGLEIYQPRVTPDRFLYAPGFAWLLAPLGLLPQSVALAFWCAAKIAALFWVIARFSRELANPWVPLAVLWVARPLLIDFQYGQVNLFILWACVFALFNESRGKRAFIEWALIAIVVSWKLFALPVLALPWILSRGRWAGRAGTIAGLALALLGPALFAGLEGAIALLEGWKSAVLAKGFPLESHNQSFAAFLHHYFSGMATPYIALEKKIVHGWSLLSADSIRTLAWAWGAIFTAAIGVAVLWPRLRSLSPGLPRARWAALVAGLVIVPPHLVWKPYFLMGLPLAMVAFHQRRWVALAVAFALMNLTGFDLVGYEWAARFEAAAVFLWAHLILTAAVRPRGRRSEI